MSDPTKKSNKELGADVRLAYSPDSEDEEIYAAYVQSLKEEEEREQDRLLQEMEM
jgi:hypothetical protein